MDEIHVIYRKGIIIILHFLVYCGMKKLGVNVYYTMHKMLYTYISIKRCLSTLKYKGKK